MEATNALMYLILFSLVAWYVFNRFRKADKVAN